MTVRELVDALSHCDQEAVVILSLDEEGNSYEGLFYIDSLNKAWDEKNKIAGESVLTEELRDFYMYGEEDIIKGAKCVVLYPG